MNATEKIAAVAHEVECDECQGGGWRAASEVAEAVVAVIRAMSPGELAELLGRGSTTEQSAQPTRRMLGKLLRRRR